MTVLVCGGRDYTDRERIYKLLTFNREKIGVIVHGGAAGADTLAGDWAAANSVACMRVPAEWGKFGKKAGFIRNEKMLSLAKPDLVVAFPGGVGTAMMVRLAKQAGVRVIEVPGPTPSAPAPVKAQIEAKKPAIAPKRPVRANGSPAIQPSRDQLIDRNIAAGIELGAIPI
jgi:hypothetical protein